MHFQPMPVGLEPCPDFRVFMVGGVVLNQNRSLASVSPSDLFKEADIRNSIEDRVLAVIETRAPKFDGGEDFHALALSGYANFRRASDAAPGGVEGRVLPETGFVGEEERPVSRAGFLFRAG